MRQKYIDPRNNPDLGKMRIHTFFAWDWVQVGNERRIWETVTVKQRLVVNRELDCGDPHVGNWIYFHEWENVEFVN